MFTNQMRFTGMSGIDVDGMVNQMMQAHALRLNRVRQNRDIIQWRQDIFRSVANDIQGLQRRVLELGTNRPNSILSAANWSSMSTNVTTAGGQPARVITITAGASAAKGLHSFRVESAARTDILRSSATTNHNVGATGKSIDPNFATDMQMLLDNMKLTGDQVTLRVQLNLDTVRNITITRDELEKARDDAILLAPTTNDEPEHFAIQMATLIDDKLKTAFGHDSTTTNPQRVTMTAVGDQLVFNTSEGHNARFLSNTADENALLLLMGFQENNRSTNFIASNTLLTDFLDTPTGSTLAFNFKINGEDFDETFLTGDLTKATVQDLMDLINSRTAAGVRLSINSITGQFSMESKEVGRLNAIKIEEAQSDTEWGFLSRIFYGKANQIGSGNPTPDEINFSKLDDNNILHNARFQHATDAVVFLNGQRFERLTNSFSINGFNIRLESNVLDVDNTQYLGRPQDPAEFTINLTTDTSGVKELILNFIEEYNTLVKSLRDLTETRRPRQSGSRNFFMPLTDDERKAMSEREIDLWEKQAKTGLLNRDSIIRSVISDLRNWMWDRVPLSGGGTVHLSELGISTSDQMAESGQLRVFNEERLDAFLADRLGDAQELFTNFVPVVGADPNERLKVIGLGERMKTLLDKAVHINDGSITNHAGLGDTGMSAHENTLSRDLRREDRRIENMLRLLQKKEEGYYRMFSRLEIAVQKSNSQLDYMSQMFGLNM